MLFNLNRVVFISATGGVSDVMALSYRLRNTMMNYAVPLFIPKMRRLRDCTIFE